MYIFTYREIKELLISALVITFVVAWPDVFGLKGLINFLLLFLFVGLGFMVHEIAHKITAQGLGAWSEFVMWKEGLLLALFLKIFTGATIIAPGATYWAKPLATVEEEGRVSYAGPLSNLILALLFHIFALIHPVFRIGAFINAQLALFNLLPIPPLDGSKIIKWKPALWLFTMIVAIVLA